MVTITHGLLPKDVPPVRGRYQESTNLLPRRVRCAQNCASLMQRSRVSEQARENTSPKKNKSDKQSLQLETYQLSH